MGYIKEPKGVDFVIQSEPLTDKNRKEISEFIRKYKEEQSQKRNKTVVRSKRTIAKKNI
ncbi:MAG: hypothetical protein QM564_03195 [Bergeyella sp.]